MKYFTTYLQPILQNYNAKLSFSMNLNHKTLSVSESKIKQI